MDEQKKTSGSLALNSTPQVITIPPSDPVRVRKLRVAAYARVSSSSEDQLNSFAAQNAHYTELITANPEWEFVDVYADKGITGTSAEKREDFQRLLADCRRGRVDKILVKSSSRFARNAKECLEAIRELKALGGGVCFEEQGIDTSELAGEFLTAIFAMMDQKESENISDNLRWSIDMRMRAGKYNTCTAPFGYRLVGGKLELIPEQAPIIRYIYDSYLSGKTAWDIAATLNLFSEGNPWKPQRIDYILTNERYSGNALLRKRYTTNSLPRKVKRNRGERPMYFAAGVNEAVVSQEIFDKAQELRKKRWENRLPGAAGQRPLANGWLQCGCCGKVLCPRCKNGKWYMACRGHEESLELCELPPISEDAVVTAMLRLYHKLRNQGEPILHQLLVDLQAARKGKLLWSLDIVALNQKIADITRQDRLLAQLKQQGLVDPDIFISRRNELAEQLRAAKLEKERFLEAEEDQTIQQTQELIEALEAGPDFLDAFDGELFRELVDKIIVESNDRLRFRLANGLELTEPIERMVR